MPVPGSRFANKPAGEQTWAHKRTPYTAHLCCRAGKARCCSTGQRAFHDFPGHWPEQQHRGADLQTQTAAPDQARPQDCVCTAVENNYCLILRCGCTYVHMELNNYFVLLIEHKHICASVTLNANDHQVLWNVSFRQHTLTRPVLSQNRKIHRPLPWLEHWYIHFLISLQTQCVLHCLLH